MPFFIFSLIGFSLWKILYSMFSLADNDNSPLFFFKKFGQASLPLVYDTLSIFSLIVLFYFANYVFLRKEEARSTLLKVTFIGSTLGIIVCCILLYPIGSRDFFDYLIYIQQAYVYHRDPYIDSILFYGKDTFASFGFLFYSPLVYGPAWLFISGIPSLFTNFTNFLYTALIFKIFNALLVLTTGLMIYWYQNTKKKKFLSFYLFLANPVILYEGIANAHNDVMMAFFLVLSLFCLKKRSIFTLPFFITAVLIKFFVVALTPLFIGVMIRNKMSLNKILASSFLALVCMYIYSAPFWHSGGMIVGLSRALAISQSNVMDQSSLFSFTRELLITNHIMETGSLRIISIAAFLLCGLIVYIKWVKRKIVNEVALLDTYLLFILFVSTLYPWYIYTAIALMTVVNEKTNTVFLFIFTFIYFLYLPLSTLFLNAGYRSFQLESIQTALLSGVIIIYFSKKIFKFFLVAK